jgi:hypothetical protein
MMLPVLRDGSPGELGGGVEVFPDGLGEDVAPVCVLILFVDTWFLEKAEIVDKTGQWRSS